MVPCTKTVSDGGEFFVTNIVVAFRFVEFSRFVCDGVPLPIRVFLGEDSTKGEAGGIVFGSGLESGVVYLEGGGSCKGMSDVVEGLLAGMIPGEWGVFL